MTSKKDKTFDNLYRSFLINKSGNNVPKMGEKWDAGEDPSQKIRICLNVEMIQIAVWHACQIVSGDPGLLNKNNRFGKSSREKAQYLVSVEGQFLDIFHGSGIRTTYFRR